MLSFKNFLTEKVTNLIGDNPDKEKHKNEVYQLLQNAYSKIGGIHGSGFSNPDDMVKNIPFWKLSHSTDENGNKVLRAVSLYKDKNGRKSVAVATDGTQTGKEHLSRIMTSDIVRGTMYSEKSGPSLSFLKRNLPKDHLQKYAIPYEHVSKISGEEIQRPPDNDPEILKHPELKDHFYQRKIGDEWHTKIMLGKTGQKIVNYKKLGYDK